ncbi:Methylmalonyl-CoA mutase [Chloroherpeton thalassium ATCC 35110]|uniref:Methylmalonyl-CoA mutase n=1 Tax=Chloroherpeton thalassium (strain ATCC 35110 / GB-78) TaxID=517418 RepID=B3QWV4_CHLT3|nr:methylmalonyl-CoA mutase family protein [Chloroherpeton thalassium]ACF13318.1 Methylmalonyl-CoA mutase [Chloroherpeton thalassium ATCC 35110]
MAQANHSAEERLFANFPPVSAAEWKDKIIKDLKGADYEKKTVWQTLEGFNIQPFYTAEDTNGLDYLQTPPGEFPYVRSAKQQGNDWQIREDVEISDIGDAARQIAEALAKDAAAVGLLFKQPMALTQSDFSRLIEAVDFEKHNIHLLAEKDSPLLFELLTAEAASRSASFQSLKGSLGYDPLGSFALTGRFAQDEKSAMLTAAKLIGALKENPNFKAITVSGEVYHESGATTVQELAFTLAAGNEYLAKLTELGLSADEVLSHIQFTFAIGSSYFKEIAKLRAARLLWAQLAEAYAPAAKESAKMKIHAVTSAWNMTIYDPHVNMLRATTEAMSAAIGGCDSLTVRPFDSIYKTPDGFSNRIARNLQHLLKCESYLDKIIDPASGSYYIESLTDSLASAAWKRFQEIEKEGGLSASLRAGTIQKDIAAVQAERNKRIEHRRQVFIGVTQYPNPAERVSDSLKRLDVEPETDGAEIAPLKPVRGAKAFEACRLATEFHAEKHGHRPKVFLLPIGDLAMRIARATFSYNFFGCAGFEILSNNGFKTPEEGAAAAVASGADLVVLCSSDDEYAELAKPICEKLQEQKFTAPVIIAGNPKEHIDALVQAGISDFIHVRSNVLETLRKYQRMLGVG